MNCEINKITTLFLGLLVIFETGDGMDNTCDLIRKPEQDSHLFYRLDLVFGRLLPPPVHLTYFYG